MKLVINPPIDDARLAAIASAAGPALRMVNAESPAVALAEIRDAEAFFGKLTPELLAAAGQLRWVQAPTASLEHYLFPGLIEHPLTLTNMRGLYSDVIAEHVLGMMLAFTRRLHQYLRNQSSGRWDPVGGEQQRVTFATGPGVENEIDRAHLSLGDLTLGIVGLGHIGRDIARTAAFFGMTIVAVDPHADAPPPAVSRIWPPGQLDELLAASDFVVIAAPHTPQTEHLFARPRFAAMRRSAYLINVGRGAIVKLDDLVEALLDGQIAGAGLDVFEIEPLPPDHPLWRLPNVLITPHVAGQSRRVPPRHLALVVDNVRRFVRGEPLLNVVDKRRWY